MHVVYICISVLINNDCTTHPILPFITITTKLLSKHCIIYKGTWHRDDWLSLFQFYRKTLLRSVDPKQPKMSNFHFDLSLKLSQGEVHDFSGEVQKFSGEVQKFSGGGAKRSQGRCTPPLKIRPCLHHSCAPWSDISYKVAARVSLVSLRLDQVELSPSQFSSELQVNIIST
jgi:hypothetical protein